MKYRVYIYLAYVLMFFILGGYVANKVLSFNYKAPIEHGVK